MDFGVAVPPVLDFVVAAVGLLELDKVLLVY